MKNFNKKIDRICQVSKQGLSPRQVVQDMIQICANFITEDLIHMKASGSLLHQAGIITSDELKAKPYQLSRFAWGEGFRAELTSYKKDPQAWELLKALTAEFIAVFKEAEPFTDLIGQLYEETGAKRGRNVLAQFLTPAKVADALAAFTDPEPITKPTLLSDPTCGAGALLLGKLRHVYATQGAEGLKHLEIMANDLDIHMVQMTAVQVVLSAMAHGLAFRSFVVHRCNLITEYQELNEGKQVAFAWHTELDERPRSFSMNDLLAITLEVLMAANDETEREAA